MRMVHFRFIYVAYIYRIIFSIVIWHKFSIAWLQELEKEK